MAATLLIGEGDREATAGHWRCSKHNLAKPRATGRPAPRGAPGTLRAQSRAQAWHHTQGSKGHLLYFGL